MANTYHQIYIQAVFTSKYCIAVLYKSWRTKLQGVIGNYINETECKTIIEKGLEGYQPLVSVTTLVIEHSIQIKISDNGPGIPDEIKDKIFQPFFTPKPTGQGTGLGLSLSYDIAKAQGGELVVESKIKEGSNFILQLPINLTSKA